MESLSLARAIRLATDSGTRIPPLVTAITQDEGYAIQDAAWQMRGGALAGYKIGLTNPAVQQVMDTNVPIAGRLDVTDILRGFASLAAVRHPRFAEAELVVKIGRDLMPAMAPFDRDGVAAAVGSVHAGIEICASRYAADEFAIGALVADNSNAERLVIGDRLSVGWDPTLAALEVTLDRSRGMAVHGNSAAVLGDPLDALVWLANWLAVRGETLAQGQWVATGSCTGMTEVAPDERLTARFADRGAATVHIG